MEKQKIPGSSRREMAALVPSLLLAFVIWLLTNLSKTYSSIVSAPVVAESNIEGRAEVSANAAVASARCRMSGFNILKFRFRKGDKPVRVFFSSAELKHLDGDNYYIAGPAKNSYVEQIFGDGSEVDSYITDSLIFVFPEVLHKTVPVDFLHTFLYRDQYRGIGNVSLEPDSVIVYGEASRLSKIERMSTVPLALKGIHSSLHGTRRIKKVSGIRVSRSEVEYSLPVTRYVELSVTKNIQVRNVPPGKRLQVFPPAAEVLFDCVFPLSGDPAQEVEFYIDYKDFASSLSGSCIPKSSALPQGIISYRIEPEVFDCIETVR